MGNSSSSEAPRRPHKLSKPQVGNRVSPLGLSSSSSKVAASSASTSTSNHGRFSNSYLVGSVAMPVAEMPPAEPTSPIGMSIGVATPEVEARPPAIPPRRDYNRDLKRMGSNFNSNQPQPEQARRRQSATSLGSRVGVNVNDGASRRNSVILDTGLRPLTQAESLQSIGNRASINYDMSSYEVQRLLNLNRAQSNDTSLVTSESRPEIREVTENTWKSCHPHDSPPNLSPISRTNSEASLYMPMRRRSIMQTPGVATRAPPPSIPQIPAKSSFRKSHPPTPSQSRHNSIESTKSRRMSMPVVHSDSHHIARVETPENDYRQLGDYSQLGMMKFGTLRITNGAPASPVPENEHEDEYEHEQDHEHEHKHDHEGNLNVPVLNVEVLNIREDPNAKPSPDRIRLELEHKTVKTLGRSDSGFVSSPSSSVSRKTPSKADSGYSSNVSLRSFRSLKRMATGGDRRSTEQPRMADVEACSLVTVPSLKSAAAATTKLVNSHGRSLSDLAPPPAPKDSASASPARRSSLTSLAYGMTGIFVPSSRPSNSRDGQSFRARVALDSAQPIVDLDTVDVHVVSHMPTSKVNVENDTHPNKMHRLLTHSNARGPPKVRDGLKCIPSIPPSIKYQHQLQDQNSKLSAAAQVLTVRVQPSKETLRTILSVGSTDVLQKVESVGPHDAQLYPEPLFLKANGPRRRSLQSMSHSFTQAATHLLSPRKPVSMVTLVSADDTIGFSHAQSENILDEENRAVSVDIVQQKVGINTFDQAFTATTHEPNFLYQVDRRTNPKPTHKVREEAALSMQSLPVSHPSLLTHSVSEQWHGKKARTPPPVSMRNRNSRELRVQPPAPPRSTPPVEHPVLPPLHSQNGSRENTLSYPTMQDTITIRGVQRITNSHEDLPHQTKNTFLMLHSPEVLPLSQVYTTTATLATTARTPPSRTSHHQHNTATLNCKRAFQQNTNLTLATIPNTLQKTPATNMLNPKVFPTPLTRHFVSSTVTTPQPIEAPLSGADEPPGTLPLVPNI
ncbi:hypothetical protein G7046_g6446 [Stylonectria norvegica]|nr:hypothetical protein G7046_g6446 [Stylonectria norvegica]